MGNFLRQGIRYINKKMNLKEKKYLLLDLDGVCYGKHNNYSLERVFGQVSKRMTQFISEKLKIDKDKFLSYVHEIDLSFMKEDKIMRNELKQLDMEKFIFTNGSAEHAANILTHLGVYDLFGRDKVFDIKDAGYVPKPEAETFDLMVKKFGINPKETIYIEDIAKNLSIGHERGCTTVWLINDEHFGKMDADKDFISHKIENLSLFLKEIRLLKSN